MAVSKRLRFEILRRDNHECTYCGAAAPAVVLQVEHVIPRALGGTDDPSNLVAACVDCNSGKSSIAPDQPVVEETAQRALAWKAALTEAAAEVATESALVELEQFDKAWSTWTDARGTIPRAPDWRTSVRMWLNRGLTIDLLTDCVGIAMRRETVNAPDAWRYFCGIVWRKLTEIEDRAKALFDQELEARGEQLYEPSYAVPLREDLD